MPLNIIKQIEQTICNFLWDDANGGNKHHWVGWKILYKPSSRGVLGIKRLNPMNKALLMEWWWRIGKEKDAVWAKIIKEKYGNRNSIW